jgi:hypothetical protein
VNGECVHFDKIERYCKDQAELKYGELNKNGRNECCILYLEIECLKPYADKCAQHPFLDRLLKKQFKEKHEARTSRCGIHLDCPEETYNIWMMMLTIFASSLAISSFCIICVIYLKG